MDFLGGPPGGVAPELVGVGPEVEGLAAEEEETAVADEEEGVEEEAGPSRAEAAVLAAGEVPNADGTGLRPLARAVES